MNRIYNYEIEGLDFNDYKEYISSYENGMMEMYEHGAIDKDKLESNLECLISYKEFKRLDEIHKLIEELKENGKLQSEACYNRLQEILENDDIKDIGELASIIDSVQ